MPEGKFKKKLTDFLQVPEDIVMNVPRITIVNNTNVLIENYKGVVEYETYKVRVKVIGGTVVIEGKEILIDEMNSEDLVIRGDIKCLSLNYGII